MESEHVVVSGQQIRLASKAFREPDAQLTAQLVEILMTGPDAWNRWRAERPDLYIDLRNVSLLGKSVSLDGANFKDANLHGAHLGGVSCVGADFTAAYLYGATLQSANLTQAKLPGAYLSEADLSLAHFEDADLRGADLSWAGMMLATADHADFRKANLEAAYIWDASFVGAAMSESNLRDAVLRGTDFANADLSLANLEGASLVETNLVGAKLTGSRVYGASVWKPNLDGAEQRDLIITPTDEPALTVDNLKVAQFIYLLLENAEFRDVIDTMTSKVVLLLGRFSYERKRVLDGLKEALRTRGFLPVMFDFQAPSHRDLQETVSTLAHLARFVIADISEPRSLPQELAAIVPRLPSLPIKPLLHRGEKAWGMYESIARYPWVLDVLEYDRLEDLIAAIEREILQPAEDYLERFRPIRSA